MDSLTSWGYIQPTTPEKLKKLQEYYENHVLSKKERLTTKLAEKLLALLLSNVGEIEDETKMNRKLTPNAITGLEVFYYFLMKDDEFQDAFERKEKSLLSKRFQLKMHLQVEDKEHVEFTKKFIAFIKQNFPKFNDWMDEVEFESRKLKREDSRIIEAIKSPEISRFTENRDTRLPPEGLYYDTDVKSVISLFKSSVETGLAVTEVEERIAKYGMNKLPEPPRVSPLKLLWHQVTDFMVLILLVVAIISFGFQDWIEAGVLLAVVITNVMIGFIQELKAERAIQALKLLTVPTAKVIRGGNNEVVSAEVLVPGDIISLDEGDSIPADLRIIESIGLQVIESVLTGESVPITKTVDPIKKSGLTVGDRTNMAFMTTVVQKGRGKGIVVATGALTEAGQISKALAKPKVRKTLLQRRLSKLGKILVVIAVVMCALVVGIGLARTYAKYKKVTGTDVQNWVIVGISLAVSVIPEGLVAVTTITYALGIQRMSKRNAVVRQLPAVETIGSITTICSDKTGTLTEGKMTATETWTIASAHTITGRPIEPTGGFVKMKKDQVATAVSTGVSSNDPGTGVDIKVSGAKESIEMTDKKKSANVDNEKEITKIPYSLEQVLMICAMCNNSTIFQDEETKMWKSTGDPTEVALTVAAAKAKRDKTYWTNTHGHKFAGEAPFDSDRKRMNVVIALPDGSGICMAKGAPEATVGICTRVLLKKRVIEDMKPEYIQIIEKQNMVFGSEGMRVLGLALRYIPKEQMAELPTDKMEELEKDMTFVGLIGMIDPPRVEVRPTIIGCKDAGIRVCMITGDHPRTAFAIGCKLGITETHSENLVITGQQLDAMTKGDLAAMDQFPAIFARVSPANKLKIVNALQFKGEICAMTGDGTNDAPAIKNADIGIAMGQGATDMAKDAADVILTDDNFTTIVSAIKEGRRTYDNIKKFVMYLLACNSAEIYTMLFAVIIGLPTPFTPIMILWANLIADLPPALALGIDPPVSDIMNRKPRDPKKGIFTIKSAIQVVFYGLSMAAITLSLYAIAIHVEHYSCYDKDDNEIVFDDPRYERCEEEHEARSPAKTLAFVNLTCMQIVHSFLVRSSRPFLRTNPFSNKFLVGAFFLSIGLLVAGVYIPGMNELLNQWPLSWKDWLKILLCVVIHIIFVELFKLFYAWRFKKNSKKEKKYLFYNDG